MENIPFIPAIIFQILVYLCVIELIGWLIFGKKGWGLKLGKRIIKTIFRFFGSILREFSNGFSKLAGLVRGPGTWRFILRNLLKTIAYIFRQGGVVVNSIAKSTK